MGVCVSWEPENDDIYEQFLTLFAANEPAIRAYVRRLVPTRHDAADVMQCVALVLWRKFHELDEADHFRRWAFGVARYETLTWLRGKARNRLVLADDVLELVADESAQQEARLSAQREALADCLEKLPGEQRELVLAAYAPDVRIRQVAERSGRTVSAFCIDEVALFDRALSEAEVTELYQAALEEMGNSE